MTARDSMRKFCLMNWKNYKLLVSNPLQLVFIILCPPMFTLCFAVFMRIAVPMEVRTDQIYDPIDLRRSWLEMVEKLENSRKLADHYNVQRNPFTPHLIIGWAPQGYNLIREMMKLAEEPLEPMRFVSFDDCDELRVRMIEDSMFAGICVDVKRFEEFYEFDEGILDDDAFIEPILNYSIIMPSELRQHDGDFVHANWFTQYNYEPQTYILQRLNHPYTGGFVGYVREGFILMQKVVTESFLRLSSRSNPPEVVLRRFPVLGSKQDPIMHELATILALLILLGFYFPGMLFNYLIVEEKQSQMRLFLVNMCIGNFIQFISWFITCMSCFIISSLLIVLLLKVPWNLHDAVLTQTPWYFVLLVVASYSAVVVASLLMQASVFKSPLVAVRFYTILWVACHMPNMVMWNNDDNSLVALRYVLYLIPNVVLGSVIGCIVDRESILDRSVDNYSSQNNYRTCLITIRTSFWIFLLNVLIYSAIAIYVDMWRMKERSGKRTNKEEGRGTTMPEDQYNDWTDGEPNQVRSIDVNSTKIYEVEPSNRRFKLKIKKLCKLFGSKDRPALNLFTWNVYENEVTVLMGHNGCGKSTLFKILAGLTEPSRGTVMVANYNIQTERKAASRELGLALGTKMLYPAMTVLDQLRFICRVKGMHNVLEISGHLSYYMHALQIDHLKGKRLRKLMPRDLVLVSICCAFVGNSSIILIDDIHSDLDKPTKELIWALINEEKSHRTIIVVVNTTTLAENISDRIAIMSEGELKCTGTKPFLKNMYGHGFRLICVKGKNCKVSELFELMNKHLPNLKCESNIGRKVNFVLENKDEDLFPQLIDDLEENMERLDVISFRIRDTSTEEIFLRFGCDANCQITSWQGNPTLLFDKYFATLDAASNKRKRSGFGLKLLHLRAIIYKRWIFSFKHWVVVIMTVLTYIVAAICTFSAAFIHGRYFELNPMTYNLSQQSRIRAFVEIISDEKDLMLMREYYRMIIYWYDAHVKDLDKTPDGSYHLTHNNDFSLLVNLRYMFGATFDKKIVTAWFNNVPLHVAPIALNVVHNTIARFMFNEEATIDVTLEMLPFQVKINVFPAGSQDFSISFATTICFILCFIMPTICLFFIRERTSCMKKYQFLAGARLFSYWTFTALYDVVVLFVHAIIWVGLVAFYHHPEHDPILYSLLLLCLVMAGILVILITYLTASLCRNPIVGHILVSLIGSLGIIMFQDNIMHNFKLKPKWPSIFHQYLIAVLIHKLILAYRNKFYCNDSLVRFTSANIFKCKSKPDCCVEKDYTDPNLEIYLDFILLLIWIVIVGVALFLVEYHRLVGFAKNRTASKNTNQPPVEPDLTSNKNRLHGRLSEDPLAIISRLKASKLSPEERSQKPLVVVGLATQYGKVKVLKDVNFTMDKGDCVNIDGLNNSGKSTLLKVIVREAMMKSGQIWIYGYSTDHNQAKCYSMVGYCPQTDELPPEYTPRQLLYIQSLFQGHGNRAARNIVDDLIRMLGLQHCCDRSVHTCTTGEQRLLFFALAIHGSPGLVLVDGAPAALDPVAKRVALMTVTRMQSMGSAFLFSNLAILDSERLCERAPVLFDGELWMLGSAENASGTHRSGYQLEVRFKRKINPNVSLSRSTWNRINHFPLSPHRKFSAFMEIKFPSAVIRREDESSMLFDLDVNSTTFSTILLIMRKDAFEMNIEDYFITRNMRISHYGER